jgi:predicted kinase
MRATLVTGAPCSGKNTYVAQHIQPGDLLVDYDAIMSALSGHDSHQHSAALKRYVYDARNAVVKTWMKRRDVPVWVINSAPKRSLREHYRNQGFDVVTMSAGLETCLARARAERPPAWQEYVRRYFREYEPDRSPVYALAEELVDALRPPETENSRRW